jgi:PAS domain S-box-containing protein
MSRAIDIDGHVYAERTLVCLPPSGEDSRRKGKPAGSTPRFDELVEGLPVGIVVHRERRILYANRVCLAALGLERLDQVVGRDPISLLPPEEQERFAARTAAVARGENPYPAQARLTGKDGRSYVLELRGFQTNFDGQPANVTVVRDATAEQEARIALAESEVSKAAILRSALACIVTMDHRGIVTEVNPAVEKTFGYKPADLLGKPLAELMIPPALRETYRLGLERSLANGPEPFVGKRVELIAQRADGSEFPVEVEIASIHGHGARGFTAFIRDLTERRRIERIEARSRELQEQSRRAEEQLRQAQKVEAIGRLAGGVAHDFNNILAVILSYASLALDSLPPGSPLSADLEQIRRAGMRAADLTRQLLAFSRQQVLQPRPVDPGAILAGMSKMLRRMVGGEVKVALNTDPSLGTIYADPTQIEQVMMNLVINARDAMPGGGKIEIKAANVDLDAAFATAHAGVTAGRYVQITVTDTGVGMDEATCSRIFEPFFTTKEIGKGTGLGLSTVLGIVQQTGGRIWVDSQPGRGSTFRICFPRMDRAAEPEQAPRTRPAVLKGNETILLVEDNEQLREALQTVLQRNGYQVIEAHDGGEAFLICENHPGRIDLVVADVVMPRVKGTELAERIPTLRPGTPILLMSGHVQESALRDGLPSAFLQKPVLPEELLAAIRELLDRPRRPG